MNYLFDYWIEKRESLMNDYWLLGGDENRVIILCYRVVMEDDSSWKDSWFEECRKNVIGPPSIYQFQEMKIL